MNPIIRILVGATACLAISTAAPAADDNGFVVFESNRTGNWELYRIGLDGQGERPLTSEGADNQWPAVSPDGRIIAWTLTRGSRSGIWFMNPEGGDLREAATGGSHASFLADGRLVFVRRVDGLNTVWAAPVDPSGNAGDAVPVFDPRTAGIAAHDPIEWSAGITLDTFAAWSSKPRGTSLFRANGSREEHIHKGCMPRFLPDGRHFLWVRDPGHFGVGRIDGALRLSTLYRMDAEHAFNHAYFPFLSADARWLIFAACPQGQHDHDTANYQLFLQEFAEGKPAGQPRRLTRNDATDRQPVLWTPSDAEILAQIAEAAQPGGDLAAVGRRYTVPGFDNGTVSDNAEFATEMLRFEFVDRMKQSHASELFALDDSAGFTPRGLHFEGGDGARFVESIRDTITAIQSRGEFHVGLVAEIEARDGSADGRILSFRLPHDGANLVLYQEGAWCQVAFKDSDKALDANKTQLQGRLRDDGLVHIAVTYRSGRLRLFINGKKEDEAKVRKNPKTWGADAELVLGGPVESRRGWKSLLLGAGQGWHGTLQTLEIGIRAPGEDAVRDTYRSAQRTWATL